MQCPSCHSSYWRSPVRRDPRGGLNRFVNLFSILNRMRDEGVIRDWVLFGAVAFLYYEEWRPTRDTDVVVAVGAEADYDQLVRPYLRTFGPERPEGVFTILGLPLQVIPHTDSEMFPGMVRDARLDTVSGERVKIASPEYLVVSALARFSARDIERAVQLLPLLDGRKLLSLVRRHDADGRLRKNLNTLRRRAGFSL